MKHILPFVALVSGVVAGCCSNRVSQTVLRKGMDYNEANEMVKRVGADQPAVLIELPREFLEPEYVMQSYRLPSGTVIQIYGEPKDGNVVVWMIGVFTYHPTNWNWASRDDPELEKMMESGRSGVHEYDLRTELLHKAPGT